MKQETEAEIQKEIAQERKYDLLGFTIFDALHISFGIVFIIIALINKGEDYLTTIGCELLELIFAVILIGFIDLLAEKNQNHGQNDRYYTFAWLVAAASLLANVAMKLPLKLLEEDVTLRIVFIFQTVFTFLGFLFFFIGLFSVMGSKKWTILIFTGVIMIGFSLPFSIWASIIETDGYMTVLESIASFAPLAPTFFAILSFHNGKKL